MSGAPPGTSMINRRAFAGLMASTFRVRDRSAWAQSAPKQDRLLRQRRTGSDALRHRCRRGGPHARGSVTLARQCAIRVAASLAAIFLCRIQQRTAGRRRCAQGQHATSLNAFTLDPATGRLVAARRSSRFAVTADPHQRGPDGSVRAHRLQRSEQRHRSPAQRRRHARPDGQPTREARHRHLRPSGARRTLEPIGDRDRARQQRDGIEGRRTRARSMCSASTTASLSPLQTVMPGHRSGLRSAPSRFPSDQAVGLCVDRAAEPDLPLRSPAGRHSSRRRRDS